MGFVGNPKDPKLPNDRPIIGLGLHRQLVAGNSASSTRTAFSRTVERTWRPFRIFRELFQLGPPRFWMSCTLHPLSCNWSLYHCARSASPSWTLVFGAV